VLGEGLVERCNLVNDAVLLKHEQSPIVKVQRTGRLLNYVEPTSVIVKRFAIVVGITAKGNDALKLLEVLPRSRPQFPSRRLRLNHSNYQVSVIGIEFAARRAKGSCEV
jgi:hypothetical protein